MLEACEELAQDLEVAGWAYGHASGGVGGGVEGVLGGGGGVGDEVGVSVAGVGLEGVEVELDGAGEGGEFFYEEALVAGVEVVFEDVGAEPGWGECPVGSWRVAVLGSGVSVDISIVVDDLGDH